MRRNNFAPVKEGDELEVKIEAVGEKGDGIAKVDGFVLFVPKTKEGEVVKVRVTRVLKNVGFAEKISEGEAPAEEEAAPEGEASEEEQTEEEAPAEEEPAEEEKKKEVAEEEAPAEDTEDFGEEEKQE